MFNLSAYEIFNSGSSKVTSTLSIPTRIWDAMTMDIIAGPPSFHGYTVILVVVDKLTKHVHF